MRQTLIVFLLVGLFVVLFPALLLAWPGELDTSFNPPWGYRLLTQMNPDPARGAVVRDFDLSLTRIWTDSMVAQLDGKIIVSGTAMNGETLDLRLQRLTPDGLDDTSFGNAGVVTIDVEGGQEWAGGLALQSDGKILVGGETGNGGTLSDSLLVRLLPNGELDGSFGTGGKVTLDLASADYIWRLALQPDGRIIALGGTGQMAVAGQQVVVLRFQANGLLDPSFGTGGVVFLPADKASYPGGLALTGDGCIFVSGAHYFELETYAREAFVAKLGPAGVLDATFGVGGVALMRADDVSFEGVAVTPEGRILVAGYANLVLVPGLECNCQLVLARFDTAGILDTTFAGGQGRVFYGAEATAETAYGLLLQRDGKIICVGEFIDWSILDSNLLVTRFLPGGELDPSFGEQGAVRRDFMRNDIGQSALCQQPDWKIVVAGDAEPYSVVLRLEGDATVRLNAPGRGEKLSSGTVREITWTTRGIGRQIVKIKLFASLDGGTPGGRSPPSTGAHGPIAGPSLPSPGYAAAAS